jgi:hypothetical protein
MTFNHNSGAGVEINSERIPHLRHNPGHGRMSIVHYPKTIWSRIYRQYLPVPASPGHSAIKSMFSWQARGGLMIIQALMLSDACAKIMCGGANGMPVVFSMLRLALNLSTHFSKMTPALGDRLMVRRVALDHLIGVRIPVSQPHR